MAAPALGISRPPHSLTWVPRSESLTLISAEVQKAKEFFSAETSVALGSVALSLVLPCLGASVPAMREHRKSFDSAICITSVPNVICCEVGRKLYLPSGISSAAPTRFFSCRCMMWRTLSITGLDCAAARHETASATANPQIACFILTLHDNAANRINPEHRN